MSNRPPSSSSRSSRRAPVVPDAANRRNTNRASAKGTVWITHHNHLCPVGTLLDLSETGVRYLHDPRHTGYDGFPVGAPQKDEPLALAVTLRAGEEPRAMQAVPVRVAPRRDGMIEVACKFEARDSKDMLELHRKYVGANMQRVQANLKEMRARLFNEASPARQRRKPLGQILIKRGVVKSADLQAYLSGNRAGARIGQGLVAAGLVTSRQLAESLAEHFGLPFVDLDQVTVKPEAAKAISDALVGKCSVLPFDARRTKLRVASEGPLAPGHRDELEKAANRKVEVHIADGERLRAALQDRLGGRQARTRDRVKAAKSVLVRYRFYGSALQQLDPRTFEGIAANVSEAGMLLNGPVPQPLVAEFAGSRKPRLVMGVQVFHDSTPEPIILRLEPVRIQPIRELLDPPVCWIGARVLPLSTDDQMKMAELCDLLREESF